MVELRLIGVKDDREIYRLVLRPWFWLLKRTADSRIFQDMTIPEILDQVLNEGLAPYGRSIDTDFLSGV